MFVKIIIYVYNAGLIKEYVWCVARIPKNLIQFFHNNNNNNNTNNNNNNNNSNNNNTMYVFST